MWPSREFCFYLGMSMPAASHACSTEKLLGMVTLSPLTNTSMVVGGGAAAGAGSGAALSALVLTPRPAACASEHSCWPLRLIGANMPAKTQCENSKGLGVR
jgi:hypothetical protein